MAISKDKKEMLVKHPEKLMQMVSQEEVAKVLSLMALKIETEKNQRRVLENKPYRP